ncbi:hypothetical protein QTO05_00275 [Vibrio fortis]|uniref:hypothetical protein n=1 Tax=Vibrio fortis TaxID=212667 RepID=UPI002F42347F
MRYRGRRWNNILILSVIAFIGVLNLPTIIKTYLLEPEVEITSESGFPYLLNPSDQITAMHFSQWSIVLNEDGWEYQEQGRPLKLTEPSAQTLSQRWQQLVGTEVDSETYQSLSASLSSPQTIEVWYQNQEEPQRITYYQLPDFWLLNNWQGKWLAVSVESEYLMP